MKEAQWFADWIFFYKNIQSNLWNKSFIKKAGAHISVHPRRSEEPERKAPKFLAGAAMRFRLRVRLK
jgi:hypothetical protein